MALPHHIRLDGRAEPLTTARETVRFSWVRTDARTRPLRILGASAPEALTVADADVWNADVSDLGRAHIELPLVDTDHVYWTVTDERDFTPVRRLDRAPRELGAWITHPAWNEETPPSDGRSFWFRRQFNAAPNATAVLHLATAAVAAISVNGHHVREILAPGYAEYRRETPAVSLDITAYLLEGDNVIQIDLAPGMSWVEIAADRYSKLALQADRLRLSAALWVFDGVRRTIIPTDTEWSTGAGDRPRTHWYGGEDFDVTAVSGPIPAVVTRAGTTLWWPEQPPTIVTERLHPRTWRDLTNGQRVFDFGTNIAGRPRIRVDGPARTFVLRPAELTSADGQITQWSTGTPIFHRVRTADGATDWTPAFSYQGFRFVQADTDGGPHVRPDEICAEVVRVANSAVGHVESDHPFITRVHQLVDRAIRSNMHSVFTDCPHREKLGWLEQLHFCFTALVRGYDVEAHLRDALHHIRVAQAESGAVPNIAPEFADFTGHGFRGDPNAFREDPNWGRALITTTWQHYRQYADIRVLQDNADAIARYLDYLRTREKPDGSLDFGLGDWISLDTEATRRIPATHGYFAALRDAAHVFEELGRLPQADEYRSRAERVLHLLKTAADDPGQLTQGDLALVLDVIDDEPARVLFRELRKRMCEDSVGLRVGEVALPAVLRAFARFGANAELLTLMSREDVPGYGYQVASDATALTETWTTLGGDEGEGSQNHFMLAMIEDWIHHDIIGLAQSSGSTGWRSVTARPCLLPGIGRAAARLHSPAGEYALAWDVHAQTVRLEIPIGGHGMIALPPGWQVDDDTITPHTEFGPGVHDLRVTRYEQAKGAATQRDQT